MSDRQFISKPSMSNKSKLILGLSLGGLAAVIIAVVLVWYFVLRKEETHQTGDQTEEEESTQVPCLSGCCGGRGGFSTEEPDHVDYVHHVDTDSIVTYPVKESEGGVFFYEHKDQYCTGTEIPFNQHQPKTLYTAQAQCNYNNNCKAIQLTPSSAKFSVDGPWKMLAGEIQCQQLSTPTEKNTLFISPAYKGDRDQYDPLSSYQAPGFIIISDPDTDLSAKVAAAPKTEDARKAEEANKADEAEKPEKPEKPKEPKEPKNPFSQHIITTSKTVSYSKPSCTSTISDEKVNKFMKDLNFTIYHYISMPDLQINPEEATKILQALYCHGLRRADIIKEFKGYVKQHLKSNPTKSDRYKVLNDAFANMGKYKGIKLIDTLTFDEKNGRYTGKLKTDKCTCVLK